MYTALLVDDEATILEALASCFPWHQFGINNVLTAADGIQALDILSRETVHLLISDIQMPRMDGLTLLKEVRAAYPDIHCIVLSAYSEFEYAKQALQIGVENYLLKPLKKEELEETIEKALDNIYANQKISSSIFCKNILMRWAKGNISGEELSERANLLGINLYLPEYCAVIVSSKSDTVSLSSYRRECAARLKHSYEVHHFTNDHKHAVFLIGGKSISTEKLTNCFTEVATQMRYNLFVTITPGSIVHSAEKIPESYLPAVNVVTSTDPSSADFVIPASGNVSDTNAVLLAQNLRTLFQQEGASLSQQFDDFAHRFWSVPSDEMPAQAKLLSDGLLKLFVLDFPNHPSALERLHSRLRAWRSYSEQELSSADTVELLEYSHLLYRYYLDRLNPIVQSAINYIHQNYMEEISIQVFCSKNNVSPSYLGYLFKAETGMYFNNYLAQYRICQSIGLLIGTKQKINDIAQKVGFSHTTYFTTCFKKQTGLSPVKYRREADVIKSGGKYG